MDVFFLGGKSFNYERSSGVLFCVWLALSLSSCVLVKAVFPVDLFGEIEQC